MKLSTPSYSKILWQQFRRSLLNRFGLFVIVTLALIALLAPLLANNVPIYMSWKNHSYFPIVQELWPLSRLNLYPELRHIDYTTLEAQGAQAYYPPVPYAPQQYNLESILTPPDSQHWLGTDKQGRDVLSRLIHGSRISLSIGFIVVGIYTLLGILIGSLAGYFGGWIDLIFSRLIEIMMCFPVFFLILTLLSIFNPSIYYVMIVLGITGWTGIARLVRGEFLKLRDQDFIQACRSQGMKSSRIVRRHLLPNALAPVMVSATFGIAGAILAESALSFLGFGVQPPTPSWGELISQSRAFIDLAWWLAVFPGFAIFITTSAFNLVGEGLRDAIDPKMRG